MYKYWRPLTVFLAVMIATSGCASLIKPPLPASPTPQPIINIPTDTPLPPTAMVVLPTFTDTPVVQSLWTDPAVPAALVKQLDLPSSVRMVSSPDQADLHLAPGAGGGWTARWIYALVAPFPTFSDGVSLDDLQRSWRGEKTDLFQGHPLLLSASTKAAFTSLWGTPADSAVQVLDESQIITTAWDQKIAWSLVPFEALEPRWKVLRVDNQTPMDRSLDVASYPLAVTFVLKGDAQALKSLEEQSTAAKKTVMPATNRDTKKMTTVVMTGVTALVRATADRMEKKGLTYPAQDIVSWLQNADFTHISNEISFDPDCAKPNASDPRLFFCSNPKYIELLDYIHANVIDMTGNHLNDFGSDKLLYTLDIYRQHGMNYYAAGENADKARQPILLEHNGNKIAFIGCNPVGPVHDWATADKPGAAKCDMAWMAQEVSQLKADGYLPIVTFQYYETYSPVPTPDQVRDFRAMAAAGAVIVSGSQAHRPQAMEFLGGCFIHYGLGNLFFDQMDTPWTGTRNEYIDRHIFYDGRYIGTDLFTALLEDYAKPRPTTAKERDAMLEEEFKASGWIQ
jgi:hypothetical protein